MDKEIIYIDMDDTMCDFSKSAYENIMKVPEIKYPQATFDFFRKLKPIPGAIEAFHELEKVYFVMILSRPSVNNLLCFTDKAVWVRDNLGQEYINRLTLSCHKQICKGSYLIDDFAPMWRQGMPETGEKFDGEALHFGSSKFPDWESILEYLIPDYHEIEEITSMYEGHDNTGICFKASDEDGNYWDNMGIEENGDWIDYDDDSIIDWDTLKENPTLKFEDFLYVCSNGETNGYVKFKSGDVIHDPEEAFMRVLKGKKKNEDS